MAHEIKPFAPDPEFYPRIIRHVCDYVLREMTDPMGAFWSAQDAEVDAREGGNYVWTTDEVQEAIGDKDLARLAQEMYGVNLGTNFVDPHMPSAAPVNVLFLPKALHELADAKGVQMDELLAKKQSIDRLMMTVRDQRKQPGTDDKVLVSWNGLMIAGFARAGQLLNEPRYVAAAAAAATYILDGMRTEDGGLYRVMRRGKVRIPAFLEDYAFFVHGLLALHRADGEQRWLDAAQQLTKLAIEKFAADGGGYYDTLADQDDLFVRSRTTYDGAIPSGNSQMIFDLVSLYELTQETTYLDRARTDLESFAQLMQRMGQGAVRMHDALLRVLELAPKQFAQRPPRPSAESQPVRIAVSPQEIDLASGPAKVRIRLDVDERYHLNAHDPGMEGLIPLTVQLVGGDGLKLEVQYPKGNSKKFAFADEPINIYDGEILLNATIEKVGVVAANAKPKLTLKYQACDDSSCLLPQTIELPVRIEVE